MISIIFMACTLQTPAVCNQHRLSGIEVESVKACTIVAQPALAHWLSEHENLTIKRWACVDDHTGEDT